MSAISPISHLSHGHGQHTGEPLFGSCCCGSGACLRQQQPPWPPWPWPSPHLVRLLLLVHLPSHSAPGGGTGLGASAQNNVHGELDDRPGHVEVVQHRVLVQPRHELLARASAGDASSAAHLCVAAAADARLYVARTRMTRRTSASCSSHARRGAQHACWPAARLTQSPRRMQPLASTVRQCAGTRNLASRHRGCV